jgi:cyclopropane-fatty-acyl-phospholipid synthase
MYLRYLERHVHRGRLYLHLPDGALHTFGEGRPEVDWFIHRPGTLRRIAYRPGSAVASTYLRGDWDVGAGQLPHLLHILTDNLPDGAMTLAKPGDPGLYAPRRGLGRRRPPASLGEGFFRQFLDQDLHLGSAYFTEPDISLEQAQRAKCRQILAKLRLGSGGQVLDVNAQWGGLAFYLASQGDLRVTALTRSRLQLRYCQREAQKRGLQHRVSFRLAGIRECRGRFDGVVSLGLRRRLLGPPLAGALRPLRDLLHREGILIVQSAVDLAPRSDSLRRRFGRSNPSPARVLSQGERSDLHLADVEIRRDHPARTFDAWYDRFQRNRPAIAHRFGERFTRAWEFHLAAMSAAFRLQPLAVMETQWVRDADLIPRTRDYLLPHFEPVPGDTPTGLALPAFPGVERDDRR